MDHDARIPLGPVVIAVALAFATILLVLSADARSAPRPKQGTIDVSMILLPADDDGTFALEVRSVASGQEVVRADGVQDGDATGVTAVDAGDYLVRQLTQGTTTWSQYQRMGVSCNVAATGPTADGWYRVTVGNRANVTCAFTNARIPRLALTASLTNDNGGTAGPTDFALAATGATVGNEVQGAGGAVSTNALQPDTFTLSATGPGGYAVEWVCVADGSEVNDGDQLVLAWGDDASCTAQVDDVAPVLNLLASPRNDHGGTVDGSEIQVAATGALPGNAFADVGESTSPETLLVDTFTLSEVTPAGYASGTWTCVKQTGSGASVPFTPGGDGRNEIALGLADEATCTVVNDDIAPQLALVAVVVNGFGGSATPADVTLLAEGSDAANVVSGRGTAASTASLQADEFSLSWTGPDGYDDGEWACVGGGFASDTIALDVGQTATCTVTIRELAPEPSDVEEPWEIAPPPGVRGTATLRGPRGCVGPGTVATRVRGRNIASIRFYRDARLVKRVKVNSRRPRTVVLRTRIAHADRRMHMVIAVVRFLPNARPATKVLTQRFGQCEPLAGRLR